MEGIWYEKSVPAHLYSVWRGAERRCYIETDQQVQREQTLQNNKAQLSTGQRAMH